MTESSHPDLNALRVVLQAPQPEPGNFRPAQSFRSALVEAVVLAIAGHAFGHWQTQRAASRPEEGNVFSKERAVITGAFARRPGLNSGITVAVACLEQVKGRTDGQVKKSIIHGAIQALAFYRDQSSK